MARSKIVDIENPKARLLAKNLRKNVMFHLEEKGWTMQTLSEKSQLGIGTIQEISQGKITNPRLHTIVDLSDALGLKDPLELLK